VFTVHEASQGWRDLNGDGDSNDGVLHLFNLANGQTLNVHLATDQIFVAEGRVAFLVPEEDQGRRSGPSGGTSTAPRRRRRSIARFARLASRS
jgi:hypothetical protein